MMPPRFLTPILLAALLAATPAFAQQKKGPPTATPVPNTDSFLELSYVPKDRLTGDPEWDKLMALNLYVPKDNKAAHPLVLLVHGGSYTGGDKNEGHGLYKPELAQPFLDRGYAVASLNYVLAPADIFPQVFWDFRTAIRFLRANADQYKLDPDRMGAVGFSAGGWLISSATWTDADVICKDMGRAINIADLAKADFRDLPKRKNMPQGVTPMLLPMDAPEPPLAQFSARLNALSFDWSHNVDQITPDDPAINVWGGLGFRPTPMADLATKSGLDFVINELTDERYKGQSVHVPNLKSPCLALNSQGSVTLTDRIVAFMDDELIKHPRALAPEVRPNQRVFARQTAVSFVVPAGYRVCYTTDGSEPTADSPAFDKPFTLDQTATVKALALKPGFRPSGVVTAHYFRAPEQVPPRITAPDTVELPRAKVGQPYTVAFKADKPSLTWNLGGRLAPYIPFQKKETAFPLALKLDATTGTLTGTPDAPGRYWLQIQAAPAPGRLAATRDYLLIVDPQ